MKQQIRVLGIDDSPFEFGTGNALVVGALVRIPNYIEGVMKTEVVVDGTDSTEKIVEMVSESRYREQIKSILIDGIALAGFNLIDIELVHAELEIPILTITRDRPDLDRMKSALMKHFDDWRQRYDLIARRELRQIVTEHNPLYASGLGLDWTEFEEIVRVSTVRGVVPEPLRIAHLIASAMTRGESYGRP
jgi:endonuclease V-like protein UPF0215 family